MKRLYHIAMKMRKLFNENNPAAEKTAAGYLWPQAKKNDYGILALYPLSYRHMAWRTGFEPATPRLTDEVTAIYTMACSKISWWDLRDLNLGRVDLQPTALPTELRSHA